MKYSFNNISYNKRPLTDDLALFVVAKDIAAAVDKASEFEVLTKPYKRGELAAQQDACPATEIEGLRERVDFLKKTFEGFRIRRAQLSGIIAVDGAVGGIDEAAAEYMAACGSIAVIAAEYRENADKILLSKGIIPLVSAEPIPIGSFILIRNIRRNINIESQEAYSVYSDRLETVNIRLSLYSNKELDLVLN